MSLQLELPAPPVQVALTGWFQTPPLVSTTVASGNWFCSPSSTPPASTQMFVRLGRFPVMLTVPLVTMSLLEYVELAWAT